MLQILAMSTMLIDHVGHLFFPYEIEWRMIGRIAFPLYCFGIVLGYKYTRDMKKYMLRLFVLAIISQLPFSLAFQTFTLNVIVTLLLSLLVVQLLDRTPNINLKVVIVVVSTVLSVLIPMDYSGYGLLLVLIYRYASPIWMIVLHLIMNSLFLVVSGGSIQMFSIISTLLIVMLPQIMQKRCKIVPTWLWRSFYPAHLLLLAGIYYIIP